MALRDVTERKRIEKEQRFLAEAGAVLSSSLDYEQTLATVGELVVRDFADWCIVDIVERDGRPTRLKVVSADPATRPLAERIERMSLDRRRPHLVGTVLETRRPFLIERMTAGELESLAQNAEHLQLLRAIDPRSVMGLPLLIRGQLLGVLVFISSTPSRLYGPGDLRLAEALAERAALAIENGRLYQTAVHATRLRDEVLGVVAHDLRNPLSAIQMQAAALAAQGTGARAPQEQAEGGHPPRRQPDESSDRRPARRLAHRGRAAGHRATRASPQRQLRRRNPSRRSGRWRRRRRSRSDSTWRASSPTSGVISTASSRCSRTWSATRSSSRPPGGRITVGAAAREDEVLFWVADTGCGISPDDLPHVFDRFWQAKKGAREGAGLGLPITRGIVEAHGGRIWVESTPGRGSIFFFTIPQAASLEAPRLPEPVIRH